MTETKIKNAEGTASSLQALYKAYGYLPFKMSKFEEYDLYAKNKEFLVSDRVITFTDTDGKLMALKPDVTLSMVKTYAFESGVKRKLSYLENVYRVSGDTGQYKEILQAGLECMGDVTEYEVFEAVYLAVKSLENVSSTYALDLADAGLYSAFLEENGVEKDLQKTLYALIGNKNKDEARSVCEKAGVSVQSTQKICAFIDAYGDAEKVIETLKGLLVSERTKEALARLERLVARLKESGVLDAVRLDFSVVKDAPYYNGVVFKGFVQGVPEAVLSGGQYDALLKRNGKAGGAIGFAVYLDLLSYLFRDGKPCDVDVVVLYDETTPSSKVIATVQTLIESGKSVSAQGKDGAVRAKETVDLRGRK